MLLGKIIALARQTVQTQEAASRDLGDRQAIAESAQMLRKHEPALCSAYPGALLRAFSRQDNAKQASVASVSEVQFDQLELMDETQVLSTVAIARVLQVVKLAAEASLADLDRLISSVLGLERVRVEANVLRPESYVHALQEVVEETRVPPAMRAQWFNAMAAALGQELRLFYVALCGQLRKEGVVSVAYAVPNVRAGNKAVATVPGAAAEGRASAVGGDVQQQVGAGPCAHSVGGDSALLTLDKLRKLLTGESISSQPVGRVDQFAEQFSR